MARGAETSRSQPPPARRSADAHLRIGDAERNEVADALSQHFSAGRIDEAELKERLDRAMSAKTGVDLEGILADLPPLGDEAPSPSPVRAPVRHRGGPGALWLVLGIGLLALTTAPLRMGAWMWFPRVPWVLFGIVALAVWRRSRRSRWRHGSAP